MKTQIYENSNSLNIIISIIKHFIYFVFVKLKPNIILCDYICCELEIV